VHEAGHLVVACHLGVDLIDTRIWRTEEGAWRGSVDCYTPASRPTRLKVAVAGAVAENVWRGATGPCDIVLRGGDCTFAGLGPDDPSIAERRSLWRAVVVTTGWLRRGGILWPYLIWTARRLLLKERGSV
jgi:hypothetical protein